MANHELDLRDEIEDETEVLAISEDYRKAKLDAATVHLLDFAAKLTWARKGWPPSISKGCARADSAIRMSWERSG